MCTGQKYQYCDTLYYPKQLSISQGQQTTLRLPWNHKRPRTAVAVLKGGHAGGVATPGFRTDLRAAVTGVGCTSMDTDMLTKGPERSQLSFGKAARNIPSSAERPALSSAGTLDKHTRREIASLPVTEEHRAHTQEDF